MWTACWSGSGLSRIPRRRCAARCSLSARLRSARRRHSLTFTNPVPLQVTWVASEGVAPFAIVRDDLTHPLLGGNKFRKLDGWASTPLRHRALPASVLMGKRHGWWCRRVDGPSRWLPSPAASGPSCATPPTWSPAAACSRPTPRRWPRPAPSTASARTCWSAASGRPCQQGTTSTRACWAGWSMSAVQTMPTGRPCWTATWSGCGRRRVGQGAAGAAGVGLGGAPGAAGSSAQVRHVTSQGDLGWHVAYGCPISAAAPPARWREAPGGSDPRGGRPARGAAGHGPAGAVAGPGVGAGGAGVPCAGGQRHWCHRYRWGQGRLRLVRTRLRCRRRCGTSQQARQAAASLQLGG